MSLSTTPGYLRAFGYVITLSCLAIAALSFLVVNRLAAEADRIASEAQPAIVGARSIQTSLAEANAAAATAFLIGEVDPADRQRLDAEFRQAYQIALTRAATDIEGTARLVGDDEEAHVALASITSGLARYSGLIEAARANNRQGWPIGAAYLDEATLLLEREIYPATDLVANLAAADYRRAYDGQLGLRRVVGLVAVGLLFALTITLMVVQLQMQRRFKRLINPPLAVATAASLVAVGWLALGVTNHTAGVVEARTDGYDGIRLVLDLRGNAFGARADEARFLIARGAGDGFEAQYQLRADQIEQLQLELDRLRATEGVSIGQNQSEGTAWLGFDLVHETVVDEATPRAEAVGLALGDGDERFTAFANTTEQTLVGFQSRFDSAMGNASRALTGLELGVPILLLLTAGLAAYGLQLRINEYR